MPRTSEMIPSRFVKQVDVTPGQLWTIEKIVHEQIGRGEDAEMKWVAYFKETPKCLSLNATNIKRMEKAFGSDNTDDWIGKQIVVFWDEEVQFGNDMVGGIRVRAPKSKVDDLPF
jgi:hypothetical protein